MGEWIYLLLTRSKKKVEGCVATDDFIEVYLWTPASKGAQGSGHRAFVSLWSALVWTLSQGENMTPQVTCEIGGDSR